MREGVKALPSMAARFCSSDSRWSREARKSIQATSGTYWSAPLALSRRRILQTPFHKSRLRSACVLMTNELFFSPFDLARLLCLAVIFFWALGLGISIKLGSSHQRHHEEWRKV